jgi:hypothetical protein
MKYNTYPATLQDLDAFFCDVQEISREADTLEEFYEMMQERKEKRLEDLLHVFDKVVIDLTGRPSDAIPEKSWGKAVGFFRRCSLDSLVMYLASLMKPRPPEDKRRAPKLPEPVTLVTASQSKAESKAEEPKTPSPRASPQPKRQSPSKASSRKATMSGRVTKATPTKTRYNLRSRK